MLLHFSFKDPATTEIYTLSLHDALPILHRSDLLSAIQVTNKRSQNFYAESLAKHLGALRCGQGSWEDGVRSEEHTSELQSLAYLVCRLLLEKKNIQTTAHRLLHPHPPRD